MIALGKNPMAVPELVSRGAEKQLNDFCREQNAASRCESGCLTWEPEAGGLTLTLVRPSLSATPLARFRYSAELGQWTLHYHDAEGHWRLYLNAGATLEFGRLLKAVDADPFHFFWPE